MAKIKTFAAVVLCAVMFISSSCEEQMESTYVGFSEGIKSTNMKYESMEYIVKFDTIVNELFTVEQNVLGDIVEYENDQAIDVSSFFYELDLNVKFNVEPQQVYVLKKEQLSSVAMTSSNVADKVVKDSTEDGFTLTSVGCEYEFVFNEGEKVVAKSVYEKVSHMDTTFSYAEISRVSYKKSDSKLDEVKTNEDSIVHDVNFYFDVEMIIKRDTDETRTYVVRVPVERIYMEELAEAVTEIKDLEYKGKFAVRESELYTVEQYDLGYYVTTLKDKEVTRKMFKYDLDLNVKFDINPKKVTVDSPNKLTDVALKSATAGDEVKQEINQDEFTKATVERDYEFVFNEGEVVTAKSLYQYLYNKDMTFAYAEIRSVTYKRYDTSPNPNSSEDVKIYDIDLYFEVDIEGKEGANIDGKYEVVVSYQRVYEVPDTPVSETVIENVEYVGQFDTITKKLFTVKQEVNGDFVTYTQNNEEISKEHFERKLNLEAIFDIPAVVYVNSEQELADVSLTSSSKDGNKETKSSSDGFTTITRSQNYNFKFNCNENVVSATEYDRETYGDTLLIYSSIDNITYKNCNVEKNEAKSNVDSTVYDVMLYFNVNVKRHVKTTSKTHLVAVPYARVLKHVAKDTLVKKNYRDVRRKILSSTTELVSFTEYEIWSVSGEKNAKTISKVLNFGFTNPSNQTVYTTNTNYKTMSNGSVEGKETSSKDGNWTVYTQTNNYSSTADNGNKSFNNKYSYNSQKAIYTNEHYTVEFAYGNWSVNEGSSNVGSKNGETTYNGNAYEVYPYVNNVSYTYDVEDDSYSGNGQSNVNVCIEKPEEDILVAINYRDVRREILSSTTELVSFTEYEIWSVSGAKNAKTISKVLNFGFNNPSSQTVYTTNTNYKTMSNGSVEGKETSSKDGNWTVYTQTNNYSSTADNGNKSFNNKYSYNSQKAIYTNEHYTVEFDYGSWSVSEGSSNVGSKNGETTYNGNVYEVYPYVNNVSYTYDVEDDSYSGNGQSNVNVCIEKEVGSIIPEEWGKIIGAGISAVPADDVNGTYAKKCLCIRTENGAVSVVFDMNSTVPTVEQILGGNFVVGDYDATYNSGVYTNGEWEPAIAKDLSDRIAYYQGETCMRNIRHTTLQRWNWRNGNMSTVVDGYVFSVSNNGTITIMYNGQSVMQMR